MAKPKQRSEKREAPLVIRMSAEQKQAVQQLAAAKGLTKNAYVREIVTSQLAKESALK